MIHDGIHRVGVKECRDHPTGAYKARLLWSLKTFIEERVDRLALAGVVAETGVALSVFDQHNTWISSADFEAFLAAMRAALSDDDAFKRAASYKLAEAYGPIRYVLWATTPSVVLTHAVKNYHLVSTVGTPEIAEAGPTSLRMRVRCERPYSRLVCLLRQSHCEALPTLWGHPPASLHEAACVARGDAVCDLHFRWRAGRRRWPIIASGVAAATATTMLPHVHAVATTGQAFSGALLVPLLATAAAGLGAFLFEDRRHKRADRRVLSESREAMRLLAGQEADAQRELGALHQRQRDWARALESEVADRARRTEEALKKFRDDHREQASRIRGVSHDLKSPLQVIAWASAHLRAQAGADDEAVDEIERAAERMNRMIDELVNLAVGRPLPAGDPQRMRTSEIAEAAGRRLRSLVHGRDIRVGVLCSPAAPHDVVIDPTLLDRVVDNLLGNAAKYTERGSVEVSFDGANGALVMKVEDTGRGMAETELPATFVPGGSRSSQREGGSPGLGLSIVLRILAQVGGKLEVASTPGEGTTFWVIVPSDDVRTSTPPSGPPESHAALFDRIVTVRRRT